MISGRLRGPGFRLFLTATSILFAELLLIRWIPSNVVYVGYFRNFLLMASFLGIGVGILWGRDPRRVPLSPFGPLLLSLVFLVTQVRISIQVDSTDEIFFGLSESTAADINFLILPLMMMLTTLIMAGLAVPLGPLLTAMPPLRAYSLDILGSMTGIALFTLVSALGSPPHVWFIVLALVISALGLTNGLSRASAVTAGSLCGVVIVAAASLPAGQAWSPYYRIDVRDVGELRAVDVNGIPHQTMLATDRAGGTFYDQAYRWFPERTFDRVLVIGAGTGTDVALALERGASRVDAVEIDPAIQAIGVAEHPDLPYDDPRVVQVHDDGRAFLRRSDERYDLIVFALPDSLTLASTAANLRLESFLFTDEAFREVRDHLADDGLFVMYNYYREEWLIEKLAGMLEGAFGSPPIVRTYDHTAASLAAGPIVAALDGAPPPGDEVDPMDFAGPPRAATDDWPFLYLRDPVVAPYYLVAIGVLIAFAVLLVVRAARRSGTSVRRFSPHFFVLGVAFLLLETRSLVTFSLLFGSTWIVNSLVFFAVLASVLLAIAINQRFNFRSPALLYAGLFGSLALGFLLPPATLLIEPPWLRYGLAAVLAFAPVFFANLVFSYSFRDTKTADMAFASNLLGAVVGGALEYLALVTGYGMLLVVIAVLYLAAWLLATRFRRFADVDLAPAGAASVPTST